MKDWDLSGRGREDNLLLPSDWSVDYRPTGRYDLAWRSRQAGGASLDPGACAPRVPVDPLFVLFYPQIGRVFMAE